MIQSIPQFRDAELLSPASTVPHLGALAAGTVVLTLSGAIPVEHLTAGDRIITRAGARPLRAVRCEIVASARMIRISASALGIDQPDEDILLAPDQPVLIRDWRAKAMKGVSQAMMPASALVDGEYIRSESVAGARVYTLEFDAPAVIYAGGLELATFEAHSGV
ncbi:MAG: Hint domain-containing protein [Pseudorhodobacter sp.]